MADSDKEVQLQADLERSGGRSFRFSRMEFSGSLGDLGLFLPLVAAMTIALDLNIGMILICAGAMNIFTGILFRQPIPVQPMKAIAIVVITEGLARDEMVAAGLLMGVLILVLSGFVTRIIRIIPKAVVRGIQLGVGLKLAAKGAAEIGALEFIGWDSILLAIGVAGFLVVMLSRSKPVLLYVFLVGFLLQYFEMGGDYPAVGFSLPEFGWLWPEASAWKNGFVNGALPQLPLTLLNSVIAVCALSEDYFPGRGIAPRRMSASVGIMNLLCVPLGGIPMCHGAGGLAAQYHFGARTGGSVIMLGLVKIIAGVIFGGAMLELLGSYPMAILGPMLVFAGVELARPAKDIVGNRGDLTAALFTAGFIVGVNTWVGFLVGCGIVLLGRLSGNGWKWTRNGTDRQGD